MDRDRRELERLAFSKPTTEEEAAAADDALRRLLAADAAAAPEPSVAEAQPTEADEVPKPTADERDESEGAPPAPARRRTIIPLVVVIGLLAGLGAGILVSRDAPNLFSAPTQTPAPRPSPTPILGATTNALAELATPRTPRDVYPYSLSSIAPDIEADSVHRILTTSDGATLWISRSPQNICMMFTVTGSNVRSGSTCASIFRFSDTGLALGFNGEQWDWDGSTFTTTIRQ